MEELTQREKLLFDRLPLAAMQLRTALGGIYFGARRLATPEERENDPELDRNAAVLYRSYYQLLRLAKGFGVRGAAGARNRCPGKIWICWYGWMRSSGNVRYPLS